MTTTAQTALRHPIVELMARYKAILQAAWIARNELAGPKRLADEAAFLPAALSLQETPAHPAPRRVAWVICALFVIALVWSIVGQLDIVAVAHGRIVVSDSTKTVQPLEAGVIKRVLVKDGDTVKVGQVLVELDATNASADQASVLDQLAAAVSEERRTTALLGSLRTGRPPVLRPLPIEERWSESDGDAQLAQAAAHVQTEFQDITAKLAKLSAEQARRNAEMATVREIIAKLEATLPIARQREADFKSLSEQGFMSGHAGQDRTRERIEQERDLATQRARLVEAEAALKETENARASYIAETQRALSERQLQATLKRQQLIQERSKARQRQRLTQLTAPVAGTVQQLSVHTEGGVVTPAQVLMIVVPRDSQITAEVVVDNKDIGFVKAGQVAAIKLETFPFTRYGTIEATVDTVTADAVNDEKRGAIFPATLTVKQADIDVDGKRINLSPGMNLTAEIKTGKRRVIEYLLGPVQRHVSDSFKER